MPSIELLHVSFRYVDSVPLVTDAAFRLDSGWTGVVGPNGAGKTTLLRLLAGELEPDDGEVRVRPRGASRRLCPQRVDTCSDAIRAFAASTDGSAHAWRGHLQLDPSGLDRWPTLSPGERKRWQVGAALAGEPAVLLLDEPTNHLDAQARDLLVVALEAYDGVGLVVSHDRDLLGRLTDQTLRVAGGRARSYRGGYEVARATWEAEERETLRRWAGLRAERARLDRRLSDQRRRRASAESRTRTGRRMKGVRDSDARHRFKAKRRRSAEVSLGRDIGRVRARLGRIDASLSEFRFQRKVGRSVFVDWVASPVDPLADLRAPALRAGARVLLRDVDLLVRRTSRVRIAGPNGAGKTTLLRALVSRARVPPERLLYLPQDLDPDAEAGLLEGVRRLDRDARGRLLALVAALGLDPDLLLGSSQPSPGEARKIAVASGLARHAWLVALDEPTNHLDLPTIERLEEMLAAYPGALLVVTHDDGLARRCTTLRWDLSGDRVETHDEPGEPHA